MNTAAIRTVVLICLVGILTPLHAQDIDPKAEDALALQDLKLAKEMATTKQVLGKVVELNFNNVSVEQALIKISEKADLRLMYSQLLLPKEKKITLRRKSISLYDAIWEVLDGTGLRFGISKNRQLVLMKMQEPEKEKIEATVEGQVTDAKSGETMPGVNVIVKGTTNGASTNENGNYAVTVESLQDSLVFSFIGYQTTTVPINGRTTIDVNMQRQTVEGEEMVVVGYGEKSRKSVTGSISTVTNEDITKSPSVNIGNSLSGKVPGLQTIQLSGMPGGDSPLLFLRGVASLSPGRSHPLIVVDGVERDMFQLEPSNIESISVLKDAAATAVYGVRGANGVILVETKRGREGPLQISAKLSTGLQEPTKLQEYVDSYTYAQMYNEAQMNDGVSTDQLRFSKKSIEAFRTNSHPLVYPNVNWVDYLTKPTAIQTRNSISLSGGTEAVKFFVSGGYLKQDGLFRTFNSDYDFNPSFTKYNFRTNLDIDATSTTRVSLTGYGRIGSRIRTTNNNLRWRTIYRAPPFLGAGIVDGKLIDNSKNQEYIPGDPTEQTDPLSDFFGNGYNKFIKNVLNIDLSVRQKLGFIAKGLSLKLKGSYNTIFVQNKYRNSSKAVYQSYFRTDVDPTAPGDSSIVYRKIGSDGTLAYSENYNRDRNWYAEARLEYKRAFGRHELGGLLLYNQRKQYYPIQFRGIPRGLVGIVGRINYGFDDRYMLEFNMGYNGSENFAKGNRFGLFPSVSGAWILTNEPFMEDVSFLDHLKFRASYGIVGNDNGIGRFLYLQDRYNLFAPGYNFGYEIPQSKPGAAENQLGNPEVQWETAEKTNYGIDLRFLKDRLSLSFDYFYEYRDNILSTLNTVPAYVAANLPAVNVGKVENWGYEAELKWRHQVGDFFYHINPNISFARNKILYMDEVYRNESYLRRTGHPVNQFFGYIFDGFFAKEDFEPNSGIPEHPYNARPGDLKFKDLNGDGIINTDDQRPIGYPEYPEVSFGANIGFNYKNFDFTTVWAGATNFSRLLRNEPYRNPFGPKGQWSMMQWMKDGRWTPERAENDEKMTYPRLSISSRSRRNQYNSDFWMRDASYIRLKNAEIGYNFSPHFMQDLGLDNMRVYVNGYNLLTFSKLDIVDPEQSTNPSASAYPVVRVYNFGVNLDF